MMKKTLLVSVMAMMASSAAFANGFYAGAGVGAMDFNNKETASGTFTRNGTLPISGGGTATNNAGSVGLNTELLAGYAWSFPNKLFVGLEAFGNYTTAKINGSGDTDVAIASAGISGEGTAEMKINYVYGVRVLPGFQVTPETVAYGILGYARANTRVTSSNTITSAALGSSSDSNSDYYNFNGVQLGLGSMTEVAKNVSIRGDVIYTGYKSRTQEGSVTDANGTASGSVKMEMSTLEGNVGLVYKFG